MSALEITLTVVVVLLAAATTATTALWWSSRRRVVRLRRTLAELQQPTKRRKRRLIPTPTQAVKGAVETAIMVRDHGFGGVLRTSIEELAGWANVQRPDLVRLADLDGMVTIFFSDIEDSTTLNHKLGDRAWVQVLSKHDRIVTRAVEEHDGHVVKAQGDGFMVAFGSPADAVAAAIDVQRAIADVRRGSRLSSVRVRIGTHRGSAVHRDNDLFGRNVAMAARIAGEAEGGEILVSEAVLEELGDDYAVIDTRKVDLKGIPGTHEVHAIDWSDSQD